MFLRKQKHKVSPVLQQICAPKLTSIIIILHGFLLLLTSLQLVNATYQPLLAQTATPTFSKTMDSHQIDENTPINTPVYKLEASDSRGSKIIYGIENTHLFRVDSLTGNVIVASELDREALIDKNGIVRFTVTAQAEYNSKLSPKAKANVSVIIDDLNDNPPRLAYVKIGKDEYNYLNMPKQKQRIKVNVNETVSIGHTIVDEIEIYDPDTPEKTSLGVKCAMCYDEFYIKVYENSPINRLRFSILTADNLSYSLRHQRKNINISLTDGLLIYNLIVEVTIIDFQNKPPVFVGSTNRIVKENTLINETVMKVQAIDGDAIDSDSIYLFKEMRNVGRPILYKLMTSIDEFKLHPLSGELQIAKKLDRESHFETNSVLILEVKAQELVELPEFDASVYSDSYSDLYSFLSQYVDQDAKSTSTSTIRIIIGDVNDNAPHWLNSSEISGLNTSVVYSDQKWYHRLPKDEEYNRLYTLHVKENSPPGLTITSGNEIFVYDIDYGENAIFDISLRDPTNLFEVEPTHIQGFGSITIKLSYKRNNLTHLIDYENTNERNFVVQLVAAETNTNERLSSVAHVNIIVDNVNDNPPEFRENFYRANVREDAVPGKTIISVTAYDRDGLTKNLVYSLHGQSSHLFNINKFSGLITVAQCNPKPLSNVHHAPCLDYETQRSHHLMLKVSDGELSSKVPLTIFVEDAPDNPPRFIRSHIEAVIEEGSDKIEPPLRAEAIDADHSSTITYTILEGNFKKFFDINNSTGEIFLTKTLRLQHHDNSDQDSNRFILIVQASDGYSSDNATITIEVLDANDNPPRFLQPRYTAEIYETAHNGQVVMTVQASDIDRGSNALVSYYIQSGSRKDFEIDEKTGTISVTRDAHFDASSKYIYSMEVVAIDHGIVPKRTSVPVIITILKLSQDIVEFDPQIQLVDISEKTTNNTVIYKMKLKDNDATSSNMDGLTKIYFEPGNIEGLDRYGNQVIDRNRLDSMFGISPLTGEVVVNSELDHEFASFVNFTIHVYARQRIAFESSDGISEINQDEYKSKKHVGFLLIHILGENKNRPVFPAPWSPKQPEINLQMPEEMPIGTILTQLMASDTDSKISHFKIEPPNDYFEFSDTHSGILVNKQVIDYDKLISRIILTPQRRFNLSNIPLPRAEIIQFNVHVFDSGLPQLSSSAIVNVEILPINDYDCKFEQALYEIHLNENVPVGTVVLQPRAYDDDSGDMHNSVRYQLLGDKLDWFNTDPKTGLITVSEVGALNLDRESLAQPTLVFTIIAGDNPSLFENENAIDKPKYCSASLKIHIDDVNDNAPFFEQKVYETVIYDVDTVGFPVIRLFVNDEDNKNNKSQSINSFKILSGNVNDTFSVTDDGQIVLRKSIKETTSAQESLIGKQIQLRVQVRQQTIDSRGASTLTDECIVKINCSKMNRYSPEWKTDLRKFVYVQENSQPDAHIIQLECIDKDFIGQSRSKQNSYVDPSNQPLLRYWIKSNGTNVIENEFFKIDSRSGNITTKASFDRESNSLYSLIVCCEDNGRPKSLEAVGLIVIEITDVDDNVPEFIVPVYTNSVNHTRALPYPSLTFYFEESQARGLPVGEIKAIDRDITGSKNINYCILEGNEFEEFYLDQYSGLLSTNTSLDREKQSMHTLLIKVTTDDIGCERETWKYQQSASNDRKLTNTNVSNSDIKLDMTRLQVLINVVDVNDNVPVFDNVLYRVAINHKSLMDTFVTRVQAHDNDQGVNSALTYRIHEVLYYKVNQASRRHESGDTLTKPNRLIQYPFKIDKEGNIFTQQLLTQYQLHSLFVLTIEASEQVDQRRSAKTRLEIYLYENSDQLKIRVNVKPRQVEKYKENLELIFSNVTKYTSIINRPTNNKIGPGFALTKFASNLDVADQNGSSEQEPSSTNIHMIFIDNYKILNPSQVMEKFDLNSAHFLFQQSPLLKDLVVGKQERGSSLHQSDSVSLIDKVALASTQYEHSKLSFLNVEWLESPAAIIVVVTVVLSVIGLITTLIGCCCTSKIKSHVIKTAMAKAAKQQARQDGKDDEFMTISNGIDGHDASQINNGFMSFEGKKDCNLNNLENMSIMRNLDSNNEANHRYSPCFNEAGNVDMSAHYFDVSKLNQSQQYGKPPKNENSTLYYDESEIVDDEDVNCPLKPAAANNQRKRQQVPK